MTIQKNIVVTNLSLDIKATLHRKAQQFFFKRRKPQNTRQVKQKLHIAKPKNPSKTVGTRAERVSSLPPLEITLAAALSLSLPHPYFPVIIMGRLCWLRLCALASFCVPACGKTMAQLYLALRAGTDDDDDDDDSVLLKIHSLQRE